MSGRNKMYLITYPGQVDAGLYYYYCHLFIHFLLIKYEFDFDLASRQPVDCRRFIILIKLDLSWPFPEHVAVRAVDHVHLANTIIVRGGWVEWGGRRIKRTWVLVAPDTVTWCLIGWLWPFGSQSQGEREIRTHNTLNTTCIQSQWRYN